MKPAISIIICTYNPRREYLDRVLSALWNQSLSPTQWELLIVDNASDRPLSTELDVSWHPSACVIDEPQLGLTYARLKGYQEARGDYLVYVDDDNVLEENYLSHVMQIFQQYPHLAAIAGKSAPEFEVEPESWVAEYFPLLAIRDFGDKALWTAEGDRECPHYSPVGAGMAVRREAFARYVEKATSHGERLALGRKGNQLSSCEDDDIVRTIIAAGWGVGYFPELQLTHLIAARRVQRSYLAKLVYSMGRSRIQALELHGVRIWQKIPRWTVLPRKIRTFFMYRAWSTPGYVRWRGACGTFEGLAQLRN